MIRPRPHRQAVSTRAALALSLAVHGAVFGVAFASGWPGRAVRPPETGVRNVALRWVDEDRAAPVSRPTLRIARLPAPEPPPPPPAPPPDLLPDPVRPSALARETRPTPVASVLASVRAVRPRPARPAAAATADLEHDPIPSAEPNPEAASTSVAKVPDASGPRAPVGSEESGTSDAPAEEPAAASASGSAVIAPEPSDDNEPPSYPGASRRRGEQGLVVVAAVVDVTGAVRAAVVAVSSGHARLDEAARRAVAGWRFTPATRKGVPVEHPIEVPIRFTLEE